MSCPSLSLFIIDCCLALGGVLRVAFWTFASGRQSEDQRQQLHDLEPGQLLLVLLRSL